MRIKILLLFLFSAPIFCYAGLITSDDLTYLGAFRVPYPNLGGDSISSRTMGNGGRGLTYNPINNSLIMATGEEDIVELSIPTPLIDASITNLNTSTVIQTPADITGGTWDNLGLDGASVSNGGVPGGLLVYNNKLIGSAYAYYSESAKLSHFTASPSWSTSGYNFSGFKALGTTDPGYVGGYMATVPAAWQGALGYPALTGKGCISIISRTSSGPAVSGFDPDDIGVTTPSDAEQFIAYPIDHTTLGGYGGTSLIYNMNTKIEGLVFPSGSDSLLFFGTHGLGITGLGDSCYGTGTDNIELHEADAGDGSIYCYDPVDSDKGAHGYPYIYQVWAYDANDLLDVKSGVKDTWEIVPYARWELELPFETGTHGLNGAAYDPSTQRLFIAQANADGTASEYTSYPIIHVFSIGEQTQTSSTPLRTGTQSLRTGTTPIRQ